jgi:hypothetical protein
MPIEMLRVESQQERTGIAGFYRSFLNVTSLSGFPQHRSAATCRTRSRSSRPKGHSVPTQSKVGNPLIIRKYPTRRSNSTIAGRYHVPKRRERPSEGYEPLIALSTKAIAVLSR